MSVEATSQQQEKGYKCEEVRNEKTEQEYLIERLKKIYELGNLSGDESLVYGAYINGGFEKVRELAENREFRDKVKNRAKHPNGIVELVVYRDLCKLLDLED